MPKNEGAGLLNDSVGRIRIIAEAGVNHNGDVSIARQLIEAAASAGADVIKFQTFTPELVASGAAPKAAYQLQTTDKSQSQLEMLSNLTLPADAYFDLKKVAETAGIEFLSTPFDKPSLDFLADELGVTAVKVPSGEVTNLPFLVEVGRKLLPVFLSTGMSTLDEVALALHSLAYGALSDEEPSSVSDVGSFASKSASRAWLESHVVILHCTTEYPAPIEDVNLRAMSTMSEKFGLPVGLSDHTVGISAAIAAAALGAVVIEKHLTLSRSMPGPDHSSSLEPAEFREMTRAVREVQVALGLGQKGPAPSEAQNRSLVRRGLVVSRTLGPGHILAVGDMLAVRPENDCPVSDMWQLVGTQLPRGFEQFEPISIAILREGR
jgi:N-acetylneuraminate synthase